MLEDFLLESTGSITSLFLENLGQDLLVGEGPHGDELVVLEPPPLRVASDFLDQPGIDITSANSSTPGRRVKA